MNIDLIFHNNTKRIIKKNPWTNRVKIRVSDNNAFYRGNTQRKQIDRGDSFLTIRTIVYNNISTGSNRTNRLRTNTITI